MQEPSEKDLIADLQKEFSTIFGEAPPKENNPPGSPQQTQQIEHQVRTIERINLPNISELVSISETASVAVAIQNEIDELETRTSELKSYQHKLKTYVLPAMFIAANTTSFGTNQHILSMKQYVTAKMPEDANPAYEWMEANGYGTLIKKTVSLAFDKTDSEQATLAIESLENAGYSDIMTVKQGVHGASLTAFLRRAVTAGEEVPLELFGAQVGNIVEIKPRKG